MRLGNKHLLVDLLCKETKVSDVYSSDLKQVFNIAQIIATTCGSLEDVHNLNLRERQSGGELDPLLQLQLQQKKKKKNK